MGFFRKDARWVDDGALNWTPDQPFGHEPRADDEIVWRDAESRPHDFEPRAEASFTPELQAAPTAIEPVIDAAPQAAACERPPGISPVSKPAETAAAAERLWLPRIAIGLTQGVGLFLLLQSRALTHWPGNDGYLFSALALAGLFAPLLLLEGLGEIALPLLGLWTAIAAAALASVGLYHHWRLQTGEQVHAGLGLIALAALALVIAQVFLRAGMRDRKLIAGYRTLFDTTWTLAVRLLVWAAFTGIAWALVGSGNSLMNWLRAHYPDFHPAFDPSRLILPAVGIASAAAFALTAGSSWTRRLTRKALLACLTIALPGLAFGAALLLATHMAIAPQPLGAFLTAATLLLFAVNASYRAGARRGAWRRYSELAGAFMIAALAICAVLALRARVAEFGWTHIRIYAALACLMLAAYGLGYSFAALIGIGGGRWMQRIEPVNRVMALVLLVGCVLLCTPLADPLKLAVNAQAARLAAGADPATFDFAWLKQEGVRFGRQALGDMTRDAAPEIARDAAIALATAPDAPTPPPSQIGANITVRTPGARLPETLLRRDWSNVPGAVPPCLTKPALACDAWFLDLDRDGVPEILLVYGSDARWWASVMKQRSGGWMPAASFASPACRGTLTAMRKGDLYMVDPAPMWQDILVAGFRLTAKPGPKPDLPCPR